LAAGIDIRLCFDGGQDVVVAEARRPWESIEFFVSQSPYMLSEIYA
jgi:hypothetical protein